jgi:outer membrane lipoprotein-sorting protein
MTGNITMVFTEDSLELRQWTIIDQQGQQTTVSLSGVQTGAAIPGSTFVLADDSKLLKKNDN